MKTKKLISAFLTVTMLFSVIDAQTFADGNVSVPTDVSNVTPTNNSGTSETWGDYTYEYDDNEDIILTAYSGTETEISIPSEISGDSVISLKQTFCANTSVKKATIPDTVKTIDGAFRDCTALNEVILPNSRIQLSNDAFVNCTSLTSVAFGTENVNIGNNTLGYTSDGSTYTKAENFTVYGYKNTFAEEYAETNDFSFVSLGEASLFNTKSVTGGITITSIKRSADNITVPAQLNGIDVVGINSLKPEYGVPNAKTIVILSGIKALGAGFLTKQTELESIQIPSTVETIGDSAFLFCTSLTEIVLPDGLTTIERFAFDNCTSLSVANIPDGVKSIGEYAYYDCDSLNSVFVPNSVDYIGENAFGFYFDKATNGSVKFSNFKIYGYTNSPAEEYASVNGFAFQSVGTGSPYIYTVNEDGKTASFDGLRVTPESTELEIPSSVDGYTITSISTGAGTPAYGLTKITIPDTVVEICDNAFLDCDQLTEVNISSSVKSIGYGAFENCTALTKITVPEGITTINECAFNNCSALTEVILPESLLSIGDSAFSDCFSLESITLPDGLKKIFNYAFSDCTSLSTVEIPDGIEGIGSYAFERCISLISVNIPDSITILPIGIFSGCLLLEQVQLSSNLRIIGNSAFAGCISLDSVDLPAGLEVLDSRAFMGCVSLTSVVIPNKVTDISSSTFNGCVSLNEVVLSPQTESIYSDAFSGCVSLSTISLPETLKYIYDNAFLNCGISSVVIPDNVVLVDTYSFGYLSNGILFVPILGFTITSNNISYAHDYAEENGFVFVENADCVNYQYSVKPDGTIRINGVSGKVPDELVIQSEIDGYTVSEIGDYAFSGRENITSVSIPGTIKYVGCHAFFSCTSLEKAEIADGIEIISDSSFSGCNTLTEITLPESVTKIGSWTFSRCTSLKTLVLPQKLDIIREGTFYACTSLESIEIPQTVKLIETRAFFCCKSLVSVNLPDALESIGSSAFRSCEALKNISVPDSCTEIGMYSFGSCLALETAILPANLTMISMGLFDNCSKLTDILIPENMTAIRLYAFRGCASLKSVLVNATVAYIGKDAFKTGSDDLVIKGYTDSVAEDYALNNSVTFESIGVSDGYAYTFNDDGTINLIKIYNTEGTVLTIPDKIGDIAVTSVESILQNDDTVTEIVIPESVKEIREQSFVNCSALKKVTILSDEINIRADSFYSCPSLEEVSLPNGVCGSINGGYVFYGCTSLKSFVVPYGTETLSDYSFAGCSALEKITLPDTLKKIENDALNRCTSLTTLDLNNSVYFISYAMNNCTALTEVKGTDNITYFKSASFLNSPYINNLYDSDNTVIIGKTLLFYSGKDTSYTVPDGIVTIGEYAFATLKLKTVDLPESLKTISHSAFFYCDLLETVTGGENVIKYGSSCFENCPMLSSITLGKETLEIESKAFYSDRSLLSLTIPENATLYASAFGIGTEYAFDEFGYNENTDYRYPDTVIYGYEGSSAETYAESNDIKFVSLGKTDNVFEYRLNTDGTVTVILSNRSEYVVIPSQISGCTVTGIDGSGSSTKVLEIPACVTDFGSVTLSAGLEKIRGFKGSAAEEYANSNHITFERIVYDLSSATVSDISSQYYTGKAITPDFTVTYDNRILTAGEDYTYAFSSNTSAGTATLTITGIEDYSGTLTKTFSILPIDISGYTASLSGTAYTYSGSAIRPYVSVRNNGVLISSSVYTVGYADNINAGTATITTTGKGNYTGTLTKTFVIQPKSISSFALSLGGTSYNYTGKARTTSTVLKNGTKTIPSSGYTTAYKNNTEAGTATVTLTGKGNYTGSVSATFTIKQRSLSAFDVTLSGTSFAYTGSAIKPAVKVMNGSAVISSSNYTVKYTSNKNIGTATVTITGRNSCNGTVTKTFRIVPAKVTTLAVSSVGTSKITVSWDKLAGSVTGYEIYRAKGESGTFSRANTITSASTTSYQSSKLSSATVYRFKVRAYKLVNGVKIRGAYSEILTVATMPSKPVVTLVAAKKSVTLNWDEITNAEGYECYYSTDKDGVYTKFKTIKSGSTTSVKKSSLKSAKVYYFKVRAYITVNGVKTYSNYSSVKNIKTL